MRLKRSAVLITCSLLLVLFATACSNTSGNTGTTTASANTQQVNGTTQLDNQNKRDGQVSATVTPTPAKTGNESEKGNDQDDKGSSNSVMQATPTPVVTKQKNDQSNSNNGDDRSSDKTDKTKNASKAVVNNNAGQVATPTSSSGGTMYITTRTVTINGTTMNVLATGQGMTLYYRTSDPAPGSSCTGSCAATWPPLLNHNMSIITSQTLNGKLTVNQTANGPQVLYNGHPLYTYTGDTAVGQANGQGSGGVWYTIPVQPQKMHW